MNKILLIAALLFTSNALFAQKGKVYPNFPEKFESPSAETKNKYGKATVEFSSGTWTLDQAIIGNSSDNKDRYKGKQSIRMQQQLEVPALLQMDFDLPNGASKVTFGYGSYGKDPASTFILEYSTDQGSTWTKHDKIVNDPIGELTTATYKFDIKGAVRFRVHKVGLGASEGPIKNGRLNIDDFAVYQN